MALRPTLIPARLRAWRHVIGQVRADMWRYQARMPALLFPRRYTDKMQWRKLFELDREFARLLDKIAARDFVSARIGAGRQADLLWTGTDLAGIPFDRLVPPYVVKSSHASGHALVVREGQEVDRAAIMATARAWLDYCHGAAMSEPGYIHLPRRLLVERLLTMPDGSPPPERRVFVFGGRVELVQTTLHRPEGGMRSAGFYTRDWRLTPIALSSVPDKVPLPRPPLLDEIIVLSERLGAGLSHCRVDLFDLGDRIVVGEITLYSWSGLYPFRDAAHDVWMGSLWPLPRPWWRALRAVAFGRWEIRA